MAGRFVATVEAIEEINRLYYECGVKAEVARKIGCSASTVAKYIQKNWKPTDVVASEIEDVLEHKCLEPKGIEDFVLFISTAEDPIVAFCDYCKLSKDEWADMAAIQKDLVKFS